MIIRKTLILNFLFIISLHIFAQRDMKTINDGWSFRKIEDSKWTSVNLPHTFNLDAYSNRNYYQGKGIYKKLLSIPNLDKSKQYYLKVDAASKAASIKVNDIPVSEHNGGYSAFIVDITDVIKEKNVIEIIVDNKRSDITPIWADFTFWGGIYRDVWLISTPKQHFSMSNHGSKGVFVTTPLVNEKQGVIHVKSEITNDADTKVKIRVENRICNSDGEIIQSKSNNISIKPGETKISEYKSDIIMSPLLWGFPSLHFQYKLING